VCFGALSHTGKSKTSRPLIVLAYPEFRVDQRNRLGPRDDPNYWSPPPPSAAPLLVAGSLVSLMARRHITSHARVRRR
jgi:hypothetical protein